jgi:hypothetical protein
VPDTSFLQFRHAPAAIYPYPSKKYPAITSAKPFPDKPKGSSCTNNSCQGKCGDPGINVRRAPAAFTLGIPWVSSIAEKTGNKALKAELTEALTGMRRQAQIDRVCKKVSIRQAIYFLHDRFVMYSFMDYLYMMSGSCKLTFHDKIDRTSR